MHNKRYLLFHIKNCICLEMFKKKSLCPEMFKLYKGFFEMNVSAAVLTDGCTVINSNSEIRGKSNNS